MIHQGSATNMLSTQHLNSYPTRIDILLTCSFYQTHAAITSAGKRRRKRFSSQMISSVELDVWKIILSCSIRNQHAQHSANQPNPHQHLACMFLLSNSRCNHISREKKTKKIFITNDQLCWAWCLEDHPFMQHPQSTCQHSAPQFVPNKHQHLACMFLLSNSRCNHISREKKTKKIFITNDQLCWAWCLEDHPFMQHPQSTCSALSTSISYPTCINILQTGSFYQTYAAITSAGKRRRKRFSSQMISSVEIDVWKIILSCSIHNQHAQHSANQPNPHQHLACMFLLSNLRCNHISREKKTKKIFITNDQLCWAWCLEDHPFMQHPQSTCSALSTSISYPTCINILQTGSFYQTYAAITSAGKRRRKRFSSQMISSVELDVWKIILSCSIRNQHAQHSAPHFVPNPHQHLADMLLLSNSCCNHISREKKTKNIFITNDQLCWAWCLEDHPFMQHPQSTCQHSAPQFVPNKHQHLACMFLLSNSRCNHISREKKTKKIFITNDQLCWAWCLEDHPFMQHPQSTCSALSTSIRTQHASTSCKQVPSIKLTLQSHQPGKEDEKDFHHKWSVLLSLMFGRSSFHAASTINMLSTQHLNFVPSMHQHLANRFLLSNLRCNHISREKKTKKIFITNDQLCWAWCLEDHPFMQHPQSTCSALSTSIRTQHASTSCKQFPSIKLTLQSHQPGKEDEKGLHHKWSALLSLMFGRSSFHAASAINMLSTQHLNSYPTRINIVQTCFCYQTDAASTSAGKRRGKRFSSHMISSIELEVWKILLPAGNQAYLRLQLPFSNKEFTICPACIFKFWGRLRPRSQFWRVWHPKFHIIQEFLSSSHNYSVLLSLSSWKPDIHICIYRRKKKISPVSEIGKAPVLIPDPWHHVVLDFSHPFLMFQLRGVGKLQDCCDARQQKTWANFKLHLLENAQKQQACAHQANKPICVHLFGIAWSTFCGRVDLSGVGTLGPLAKQHRTSDLGHNAPGSDPVQWKKHPHHPTSTSFVGCFGIY